MITDSFTTGSLKPWGLYGQFEATAAITKGYCVTIGTTGKITTAATNALQKVIGVAAEDIAAGATGNILLMGFCDYIVTADTLAAPTDDGTGDMVLVVVNGGGVVGKTYAELNDNSVVGNMIVGKNLKVIDSGTVCTGYVIAGSGTYAANV